MARALIAAALRHAVERPERSAVRDAGDGEVRDRRAVLAAAGRFAEALDATTEPGATVLVQGPAGAGFHAAVLAIWGSGRRALPLGDLAPEEVESLAAAHRPGARIRTERDATLPGTPGIPELEPEFDGEPRTEALGRGEDASLLLRSSGTIGDPRLSLRTAAGIDRVAATLLRTIGLRDSDRVLSALPMHHAYGIEHAVLLPILAGAEVIRMRELRIDVANEHLQDDATVLPAVPPTIDALGESPVADSSLRLVYTAGSPLPESTRRRFEASWSLPVGDLYGASEVGTITWGFDGRARPVEGVEVRTAEDGELLVRSDAMFEGYLDRAGAPPARDRIRDGWFLTGDLGRVEPDGSVRLEGRARLQFDVGGLKVNPTEVEERLLEHPAIAEVLVGPLPLTETVNRVLARVVVADGVRTTEAELAAELRSWGGERLPAHQIPRQVRLVDALPRTPSGKLIRRERDSLLP